MVTAAGALAGIALISVRMDGPATLMRSLTSLLIRSMILPKWVGGQKSTLITLFTENINNGNPFLEGHFPSRIVKTTLKALTAIQYPQQRPSLREAPSLSSFTPRSSWSLHYGWARQRRRPTATLNRCRSPTFQK